MADGLLEVPALLEGHGVCLGDEGDDVDLLM